MFISLLIKSIKHRSKRNKRNKLQSNQRVMNKKIQFVLIDIII